MGMARGERAARPTLCKEAHGAGGGWGGAASGPRGGHGTEIAAPSACPRVPAAKFAGRTSEEHPENSDPGGVGRRKREASPTLAALSVPPRSPTPHRDTRAAATCVHSSPRFPFGSRGPELRAADAYIPRRDREPPAGWNRRGRVQRRGDPGASPEPPARRAPYLREVLGGTRRGAGMRVVQVSRSARDAHDQAAANSPARARGLSLAGGRERARGGGGREPSGAEEGRKGPSPCGQKEEEEGVPPKPRPPRSGARRPAPPTAPPLPPPCLLPPRARLGRLQRGHLLPRLATSQRATFQLV